MYNPNSELENVVSTEHVLYPLLLCIIQAFIIALYGYCKHFFTTTCAATVSVLGFSATVSVLGFSATGSVLGFSATVSVLGFYATVSVLGFSATVFSCRLMMF